ncbi:unnamed protein product [Brassica napus]|uniref:(rape) hypothetical protein n=1 Tax=Brassica napus TaxID=3708 RepID=A0A816YG92_BRANA|nr:unnamed protein product [Brassica napus]
MAGPISHVPTASGIFNMGSHLPPVHHVMAKRCLGGKRRQYIDHHGTGVITTTSYARPGSSAAANRRSWKSLSLLLLGGLKVKNVVTGDVSDLKVSGLFFAIGHEPATKFLDGQLEFDEDGYLVTRPGTTKTSMVGVFAARDVQDKKLRQAITDA